MSAAALEALLTYEWPGNVRELERVIERAIALAEGDEIQFNDLPPAVNERYSIVLPATAGGESMRAWGSRYARLVLERCDNNKRQACHLLDISYHTLQAYLRYTPHLRAAQKALPAPTANEAAADPRSGRWLQATLRRWRLGAPRRGDPRAGIGRPASVQNPPGNRYPVDATSPPLPEATVPPGPRARGGQTCSPTPIRRAR